MMQDGSFYYVILMSFVSFYILFIYSFMSFYLVLVRLVNGPDDRSGRVEIYREGEWITVCDYSFGREEAQVICRSLGFG